jgi:DNA-binding response OmpR family regulator
MKILAVSSDGDQSGWLANNLSRRGHEVVIAADGDQVFKLRQAVCGRQSAQA